MDPKLAILFMLIGSIITLSHLGDGTLRRMQRQFNFRQWRDLLPGLRKPSHKAALITLPAPAAHRHAIRLRPRTTAGYRHR